MVYGHPGEVVINSGDNFQIPLSSGSDLSVKKYHIVFVGSVVHYPAYFCIC